MLYGSLRITLPLLPKWIFSYGQEDDVGKYGIGRGEQRPDQHYIKNHPSEKGMNTILNNILL